MWSETARVFDLLLGDNLPGRKEHIAQHGAEYLDDLGRELEPSPSSLTLCHLSRWGEALAREALLDAERLPLGGAVERSETERFFP